MPCFSSASSGFSRALAVHPVRCSLYEMEPAWCHLCGGVYVDVLKAVGCSRCDAICSSAIDG
eukprot:3300632-Pyramimonas_sp.AAC.1